jgi:hypothetical protein
MMKTTCFAALLILSCYGALAQPETAPELARDILGTWVVWDVGTNASTTTGLLTISFLRDGKAEWRTCVDGKTLTHTGTYDLEPSENILFPATVTHVIRLHRAKLPAGAPVLDVLKEPGNPIHLVGAFVGEDNRFPSGEKVLHFRDGFHSTFTLRNERSGPTTPPTLRR